MANIAEGFDTQPDNEFIRFLNYSKRSCTEIQSHLYVAHDNKYIKKDEFENIYNKSNEVKKLIGGFIRYLNKNKT
ncbi:MAG: four helix bundle protein [Endomicrobiales bacterium]|nr:four helix bundle protein [Endomicrobiales bacterium]